MTSSKKMFTFVALFTAVLGFVYIYLVYFSTPKDAIQNMFDGAKNGDLAKLSRNASERTTGIFSTNALRDCAINKTHYINKDLALVNMCLREKYAHTNVEKIEINQTSENEANANVTMKIANKEYMRKFKVIKMKNQWKVHIIE